MSRRQRKGGRIVVRDNSTATTARPIIFLENLFFKKININKYGIYIVEDIITCEKAPNDFYIL